MESNNALSLANTTSTLRRCDVSRRVLAGRDRRWARRFLHAQGTLWLSGYFPRAIGLRFSGAACQRLVVSTEPMSAARTPIAGSHMSHRRCENAVERRLVWATARARLMILCCSITAMGSEMPFTVLLILQAFASTCGSSQLRWGHIENS